MRRAAAAKETPTPSSDDSPHSSKRPRLSTEAESPRTSDMDAIAAALAAEEEKRQQAVARAAAEAGETHWVLDVPAIPQSTQQPMVLAADSLDADDDTYSGGRRAYGNFKRKERKVSNFSFLSRTGLVLLIILSHKLPHGRKAMRMMRMKMMTP